MKKFLPNFLALAVIIALAGTPIKASEITVYILPPDQPMGLLAINRNDTILEVKKKIFTRIELPIEGQRLFSLGQELENEKKVSDYKIGKGNKIDIMKKSAIKDLDKLISGFRGESVKEKLFPSEVEDLIMAYTTNWYWKDHIAYLSFREEKEKQKRKEEEMGRSSYFTQPCHRLI